MSAEKNKKVGIISKIFIVTAAVLFVLIGAGIYRQFERKQALQKEIGALQKEIDAVIKENKKLSEQIGYFSSQDFKEKEAKEKLNMQREGEEVVVIKPRPPQERDAIEQNSPSTNQNSTTENIPNWKKWYNLFFSY